MLAFNESLENIDNRVWSSPHNNAVYAITVRNVFALELPRTEPTHNNLRSKPLEAWMLNKFLKLDGIHGLTSPNN